MILKFMYNLGKSVAIVLILCMPLVTVAQNTCSQTLIKAQITYYEGRADEVPSILAACLKEGFTDEEKSQAYRLLTLTYLYLNETQNAENAMLAFLKLNHYYKINEAVDPTEFINLYNQFRTRPVYLITPKLGTNVSFVQVMKNFSLDNSTKVHYNYQPELSYQIGISLAIPLIPRISVIPEIYLSGKNYSYKNNLFGYESLSFNEQQTRVQVPILLMYTLENDKWFHPFLEGGVSVNGLLNSTASMNRIDHTGNEEIKKQVTGPNINMNPQRKRLNYTAVIGTGFTYKKDRNIFIASVRYNVGLLNEVKPRMRYSNQELIYKYGYLDNDFKLNYFSLSVGYVMPVFRPKKINKQTEP